MLCSLASLSCPQLVGGGRVRPRCLVGATNAGSSSVELTALATLSLLLLFFLFLLCLLSLLAAGRGIGVSNTLQSSRTDVVNNTAVEGLRGTRSASSDGGNSGRLASVGVRVGQDEGAQPHELLDRNLEGRASQVPPDDLRARRGSETSIVVEESGVLGEKVVRVEVAGGLGTAGLRLGIDLSELAASAGGAGGGGNRLPADKELLKHGVGHEGSGVDDHTGNGEAATVDLGVHNVQLGSKVTSVDRVLGEHVDVQLQSGVRATDDGNHHLVELAALGVGSLHNVVVDGEGELGCVSASARLWMFMSLSLSISLMSSMML